MREATHTMLAQSSGLWRRARRPEFAKRSAQSWFLDSPQTNGEALSGLLGRLATADAGRGWSEFLQRYSPLILQVVRRFETDHGRVMDCFVHACEQLSNDGFQRLRRYRPDGTARFGTWLSAVVANLYVDWRRIQYGRSRPVRSVARLPELDQLVYRYIYVRGMPRDECLYVLQGKYPDLTGVQLSEINARLFARLSPRQRWQLSVRRGDPVPLDEESAGDSDAGALQLEAPGPGPEELSQAEQERRQLEAALGQLSAQQRLLLRLRYEQNLTLEEVARLTGFAAPFRAHRQIQAALKTLGVPCGSSRGGNQAVPLRGVQGNRHPLRVSSRPSLLSPRGAPQVESRILRD